LAVLICSAVPADLSNYSLAFVAYCLPLGVLFYLMLFIFADIFIAVPAEALSAESTVLVAT
jgi:hypothetical protein